MKGIWLMLGVVFLFCSFAGAQKPVASKAILLFHGQQPKVYTLFNEAFEAKEETKAYVDKAYHLTIRPEVLVALREDDQGLIRIALPGLLDIQLDLYREDIFSDEAKIRTSDGQVYTPDTDHRFYRGMINGNPNSLAIVSIYPERVQLLFADQYGNKRIQQTADGNYLLFSDNDILIPKELNCSVDEVDEFHPAHHPEDFSQRVVSGNCVEVYVECDFASYQANGSSVSNTEEWVADLWNEVITLYENEDIPVVVSDVFVYTSTDPFATLNTTSAVLFAFADHIDTLNYNGRLAHLLSTRTLGGGIAYIDVLCSTNIPCAFSASLSTTIVPFPTYSWNVEVVTHEMGHNMGSPHTHACAWNGNNTQIDDCGNQWAFNTGNPIEGSSCFNSNAPILPASGTIMSYCHLISGVGINFANGFGTQPGNLIRTKYNSAPCNTGTCTPPPCTSLTTPTAGATNVDINQDLFWASAAGANGYKLTIGTTPTNGNILNNVDVGLVTTYNPANSFPFSTTIYVKIVPYNNLGDASGCTNQSFTTEANVAPQCTQVTQPANGATGVSVDAIIFWNHSIGNQTGYKISIGTTPNGTQILNLHDVGNVNSYNHPSSFPYATTLYVKITPYWPGGDISGCASQSFTTIVPVAGDFCTTAIDLPCGVAVTGSTLQALPDTGMPFCGVNIEAPGVWYTFTGNGQNTVIYTCAQYNYDTQLNAYQGSCSNLTCVTGIDDFCSQGSQITFPTTSGTTYYILVQGWGGQQGTFTLNRTCYSGPFYCQSSGYYPTFEWIKTMSFAGFTKQSGKKSYSDFTTDTITVTRGASYSISITPMFLQTARNEHYRVWVDNNQDGDFADAGELLFSAGPTTAPVSGTIVIPITALNGNTRMRVSMRYNAAPPNCGTYDNGEVEDYTLKIKCNLVTSTLDDGTNGTLRTVCFCADDSESILFASSLNGQIITVSNEQITVDGQWKWMANPGSNIEIKAVNSNRILKIPVGKSAEIQNLTLRGGTAAQGSAIDNLGTLTLRDCHVMRMTGSNGTTLRNTGMINIFGICDIMY